VTEFGDKAQQQKDQQQKIGSMKDQQCSRRGNPRAGNSVLNEGRIG
jgi:hypothetical protein